MIKKRLLFNSEASFLSTGYSTFTQRLMRELYETGKYEIAELATFGDPRDQRASNFPWRYYGNLPINDEEVNRYNQNPLNQFGKFRLNEVLLDFKPHISINNRDDWSVSYEHFEPFRHLYTWILHAIVDSNQHSEWISTFQNADAVCAYTDFGLETLQKASNKINLKGVIPCGVDLDVFRPMDKMGLRRYWGIDENSLIIGTVMRNQRRKLFSDLLEAFAQFLIDYPSLAKKSYLYLHTAYLDQAFDIGKLVQENGLGAKVLMTYWCRNCNFIYPDFYRDHITTCKNCHQVSAVNPNSQEGIPDTELAKIYNLMDLYVQYSLLEGFAIPIIEAAACGCQVAANDFSAMNTAVKNLQCIPIEVERLTREVETGRYFASPKNEDFIKKAGDFLSKPRPVRLAQGFKIRKTAEQYYNWKSISLKWQDLIDEIESPDLWNSPPRYHQPNLNIPQNLSNDQFVNFVLTNVAGKVHWVNTPYAMKLVRDLNFGRILEQVGTQSVHECSYLSAHSRFRPFNRDILVKECLDIAQNSNLWEKRRANTIR